MYHIILTRPPVKAKARIERVRFILDIAGIVRRVNGMGITSRNWLKSTFQGVLRDREAETNLQELGNFSLHRTNAAHAAILRDISINHVRNESRGR